jgi:uncharacterized lipoprotein YmbA
MTPVPTIVVLIALALPLATGCSFLKPRTDPTQYYVLTSAEKKAPAAAAPVVLGVDHVELPEYLMRPELVSRSASNQLAVAEYERWGEPLKDGFARTLRRNLENELGAGHVVAAPFDPRYRPSLVVDVEVRRFERVAGEGAVLEATWTIRDGKTATTLVTHDARARQPLSAEDARATVVALSTTLAALAREIAGAARHQLPGDVTGSASRP